jgi:hypothetical protein
VRKIWGLGEGKGGQKRKMQIWGLGGGKGDQKRKREIIDLQLD